MKRRVGKLGRRGFLATVGALSATKLLAFGQANSTEPAEKLKLGFDNFSIRAFDWKAPQLINYAASVEVDTLLMSDLDVYESTDESYLTKVRDQAERAGVELQAGTGSICPTSKSYNAKKWGKAEDHARLLIRTAKHLGTSVARCYLGSRRDREDGIGIERHADALLEVLKAVRSEAEGANVKIAIENHAGDMQAWELAELIEEAGTSFVGATVDPGNATWTMEDPLVNLKILGPYVVTTGIRDTAIWESELGAKCMWTNMGQGVIDWQAYVQLFKEVCPNIPFVLEIISYKWSHEPQYLKPDYWSKFPHAPADQFARFVALAKQGSEFEIPAGRPTGDAGPALEQAQQKFDLEQSLNYCRAVLGLGRKG